MTGTLITLFHQVEGFPVVVEKLEATLVTRSSNNAVHDKVFIPTIATMGVLVIICIFCIYKLITNRGTAHSEDSPGAYNEPQHNVGQLRSDHWSRPLSKATSVLSTSASTPGTPSVGSNMLDRLQRRREEEHLREMQQDPYKQYMSANQGYPQHYHYSRHPSVTGEGVHHVEGVQPHNAHVPALMTVNPSRAQQETQSLQQSYYPRQGISLTPTTQTSSTRVSSNVLSYMTPPDVRRTPLPNNTSPPQNQDYFSPQQPAGGIP